MAKTLDLSTLGLMHPLHAHKFQVSYSCGGVKYDALTLHTKSATYDFKSNTITCDITLDVDGDVELSLMRMCNNSYQRPTISINRVGGGGEVLYSTMCEVREVLSCEVETDYASSGLANAVLVADVRSFDMVKPPSVS